MTFPSEIDKLIMPLAGELARCHGLLPRCRVFIFQTQNCGQAFIHLPFAWGVMERVYPQSPLCKLRPAAAPPAWHVRQCIACETAPRSTSTWENDGTSWDHLCCMIITRKYDDFVSTSTISPGSMVSLAKFSLLEVQWRRSRPEPFICSRPSWITLHLNLEAENKTFKRGDTELGLGHHIQLRFRGVSYQSYMNHKSVVSGARDLQTFTCLLLLDLQH